MAKPVLKWVGGKTQLLPQILNAVVNFPVVKNYYEPFIGGGAVFFAFSALKRYEEKAFLNDWNGEIISLYSVIQTMPEALMESLDLAKEDYLQSPETVYKSWRAKKTGDLDPVTKATRTLLLNKSGFNGLYRQNKKGEFNVPWGKRDNPTFYDRDNLLACSESLQNVTLTFGDFAPAVANAEAGDLVYFDPPYLPLTDTANFSSYTSDGFSFEDHKRLAFTFRQLTERGVHCLLSNHDVPIIEDLFSGFEIFKVEARRNVNSKGDKRGKVGEVLVLGRGKDLTDL